MFFTCEVHNEKFASISDLKAHDVEFHSKKRKPTTILKKTVIKKVGLSFSPTVSTEAAPQAEATVIKEKITSPSFDVIQESSTPQMQCHICMKLFEGTDHQSLSSHLESHLQNDQLLNQTERELEMKKEFEEIEVPISPAEVLHICLSESNEGNSNSKEEEQVEISTVRKSLRNTTFPCKLCERTFKSLLLRQNHVETEHYDFDNDDDSLESDNGNTKDSDAGSDSDELVSEEYFVGGPPSLKIVTSGVNRKKNDDYKCYFCGFRPPAKNSQAAFERHIVRRHTMERPFRCVILDCNKYFSSSSLLKDHEEIVHSAEERACKPNKPRVSKFKCSKCSKTLRTAHHLKLHLRTHSSSTTIKINECSKCSACFTLARYLRRHMRGVHGDPPADPSMSNQTADNDVINVSDSCESESEECKEKGKVDKNEMLKVRCVVCGTTESTERKFVTHWETSHGKITNYHKPFKCCKCGAGAGSSTKLKKHLLQKHKNLAPFQCTICKTDNDGVLNFQLHLETQHPGMEIFYCYYCRGCFMNKETFLMHKLQVHEVGC